MSGFRVDTLHLDLPPLVGGFSRRLREAGMPITPERSADFARALTVVKPITRRQLYWTARGMFVTDQAQVKAFDAVFTSLFGRRREDEVFEPDQQSAVRSPQPADQTEGRSPQPAEAVGGSPADRGPRTADQSDDDSPEVEVPHLLASAEERLATKSFDALEPLELAQIYRLMSRLEVATPARRTRRHVKSRHGTHIDMRRTLRGSLRSGGDPVHLRRRRRRIARRRLVMLCDISGSMEPYARAYLQFLTSAVGSGPKAEVFVFATRLTRLTRALSSRNPERAIQRAAQAAPDWSSGTRIGDALKAFNDRHGRRGMARGAVIVILSDGWERGDPQLVSQEMERLSRLAHRIVWVNPRVAASFFTPRTGGMRAALPYCDELVSGHSFVAMQEVVRAIHGDRPADRALRTAHPEPEGEEDWASAVPVAGSSVAMPSGHGPSRGKTTPGWVTDDE
ncbi:MAG TPA: VWA domain-containing protein [Thermoleophilaceae bacterium]